jgi:Xaa-Pro aminopeptidase
MKRSAYRKRITALRKKLERLPVDTLWIIQPENRRYLSGFTAEDTQLTESSGSLLVNRSKAFLVTDSRYTTAAEKEALDFEVITVNKSLLDSLPDLLADMKTKKLGFEENYITCGLHHDLAKRLRKLSSPVRLVPLKDLVEGMRLVKDNDEIKAMEASSNLMCAILSEVIPSLKPGRTEKEIAWQMEGMAREGGAEDVAFPLIVASGPNSALPHAVPTDRRIRAREPITLDVGVKLDGYCCDMTRTLFLDGAGRNFKKIYRTVREAQRAAMGKILPGTQSTVPDAEARQIIREAGFSEYFGHSLGHGVGLATHEGPRLSPQNPVELQAGMVVTDEPGIYIPGKGGVRLEEMLVIEKHGPRVLTKDNHFYDF